MQSTYTRFLADSASKSFDLHHRETIAHNISRYDDAVLSGKEQFLHLDLARRRAATYKHHVLENLEDQIKIFEQNFTRNGGKLIWAENAVEAKKAVLDIFQQNQVKLAVKSKSMVTEEIGLVPFLEKHNIECVETDLGEYVVQLTDDKPYHIVTPIMHLSARDVAGIFHEKFGLSKDASPADITGFVRARMRASFFKADAGITGANFLIAETGSVAVTENEGNGILSMAMPRIHIIIAGVEKLIESLGSLHIFWPLLASHGTGQSITAYNTVISGPRSADERDGPEQVYVILLDNGRSRLLGTVPQRRSLACIRCGACLNACPVYRSIGGHSYGTVYSGPIGAVISPFLTGKFDEFKHLSFASSLCGKCTDVCPVGIDLHHQLLRNRRYSVKKGYTTRPERWMMWLYKMAMKKRNRMDFLSAKKKNHMFNRFMAKGWGDRRNPPTFVKSFASKYANLLK